MQAGVYCLSSELNDSKMNKNIYGQCQLDVLNADFSTNFSDGGLGSGFSLNGVSISGKLG